MRIVIIMLIAVATLSACNTVSGFGEDMRNAGSAIEKAANR